VSRAAVTRLIWKNVAKKPANDENGECEGYGGQNSSLLFLTFPNTYQFVLEVVLSLEKEKYISQGLQESWIRFFSWISLGLLRRQDKSTELPAAVSGIK
jgi:hypothetical protein